MRRPAASCPRCSRAPSSRRQLVYILNRDATARLTISSPLEAHKAHTIVFHVAALDVGFENPVFACIEADYEEADEGRVAVRDIKQSVTLYELDLGLNHVVRKHSQPLDARANLLVPCPGGADGPSGLLVCCDGAPRRCTHEPPISPRPAPHRTRVTNRRGRGPRTGLIIYKRIGEQEDVSCAIPRRKNDVSQHRCVPLTRGPGRVRRSAICLSVCLPIHLPICLSASLSLCPSASLPA